MPAAMNGNSNNHNKDDKLYSRLYDEATQALKEEPELSMLLHRTVLAPGVHSFEEAVASTICYRLLLHPCNKTGPPSVDPMFCPNTLRHILLQALLNTEILEAGHCMSEAVRQDCQAILDRDPATETVLEVVLFFKGFAAMVCHRAARQKCMASAGKKRSMTALFLQSQASAVFAVDIHPAATIGAGIMLDHGTGIVIGETAVVGDGCTLLHGVTLGGTGKESGDRHPKLGKHVLIGANASILGNINIGDRCKIGAGSIVLRPIPAGATAVGAPAKIIGRVLEEDPALDMDDGLTHVGLLHKSSTISTLATADESDVDDDGEESLSTHTSTSGDKEEEEDDDDDINSMIPEGCNMCPYREYAKMAQQAPKGTVTIITLRKLMLQTGATECQVGPAFFALDIKNVGFVNRSYFAEHARDVLNEYCPDTNVDKLVHQFLYGKGKVQVTEVLSC